MRISEHLIFLSFVIVTLDLTGAAQTKRTITVRDCVTARYLNDDGLYSPLQINRQSTRIAYAVKAPNLEANRNEIQLYVKSLSTKSESPVKRILVADTISQIHWAGDDEHVFILTNEGPHVVVANVDVASGERNIVAKGDSDIKEFSVDAAGDTVVFATDEPEGAMFDKPTTQQMAQGYRILFQSPDRTHLWIRRRLFLTRRSPSGTWSQPQAITISSAFSAKKLTSFAFTPDLRLSISPDGKELVFTYLIDEDLPRDWARSMIGGLGIKMGVPAMTVLLIDLSTMQASLPFKTAWAYSLPLWSADSKSFVIAATPPVGSSWDQTDIREHQDEDGATRLFWVEPGSGKIEEVARHVKDSLHAPLWWGPTGEILVQLDDSTISRLSHSGGVWHEVGRFHIPWGQGSHSQYLVSDGVNFIEERDGPAIPPELLWYDAGTQQLTVAEKLDPQFDTLTIAPMKRVEWKTSTGYTINGMLLLPPAYSEKQAYPLVIQAYHEEEKFVCDYGEGHWPSLVPQPLADAGILYLIRTGGDEFKKEDLDHRPKQYPGGIGEAALQMDIWDSAVRVFALRGWVDPHRVGIIGFSRTGWYTEFILSHSKIHYAAATDTDNVTYSLGTYWLFHSKGIIQSFDAMYGGNPYGADLKNWEDYSATFNIDKIHTPILMEEMGYGIPYDNEEAPPLNLSTHFDFFTGLNRLNKPVELYYYPMEEHTPDHPLARLYSLQRNVDWYRFWLQNYERPNPEDPQQYERWEHLQVLQRASEKGDATP
jgi:dipeptidyl aminopeptidase/acylaminoacyl peptidase